MIELKNLSIYRGDRIVIKKLSCSIKQGEITAIIGPNGAGKSTLLSAIAGDAFTTEGEILLAGQPIHSFDPQSLATIRAVGQQSHTYWMAYSAREILILGNELVSPERFQYVIDSLEMQSFLDQKVTALSGGQLQRIEIARACMRDVSLILLDEPFASQDLASIERVKQFLISEKESGKTIVMVAHAQPAELSWCDQLIEIGAR